MMRNFILLFVIFPFVSSCSTSNSVSSGYDNNIGVMMHPNFSVYHNTENTSTVYFQLSTDEVLYTRNSRENPFQAALKLHFRAYKSKGKDILDSGTLYIKDVYSSIKSKSIDTSFSFNFQINNIGYLKIFLSDLNRSRNIEKQLNIDKLNIANQQFFKITDSIGNQFLNKHYYSDQKIYISSVFHANQPIYALRNNTVFPLPTPPFSKSAQPTYAKKTAFAQQLHFNKQNKIEYVFPKKGFVYFQSDTLSNNGFALFSFNKSYPDIKQASELVSPLRYLSTREEYRKLTSNNDSKKAVDEFWLTKVTSKERARTLIRTYYSRVELANELFTSYIEGWKTDRGLISIIFGPPNYVRKNKNFEIWIYGNENNTNTIKFTFDKVINPFSENDYVLKRNYAYKSPWYRAVETWRSGKVYWVQ